MDTSNLEIEGKKVDGEIMETVRQILEKIENDDEKKEKETDNKSVIDSSFNFHRIPAHKLILSISCDLFRDFFAIENSKSISKNNEIQLSDDIELNALNNNIGDKNSGDHAESATLC